MDPRSHSNPWANWPVTPGSHAAQRLPAALADPGVLLRPQTLAEAFHTAGLRLGATAVDLAHSHTGASPFARLFQAEPAFLYAELLAYNTADAGFVFAAALESDPPHACRLIATLARQLQIWRDRMRGGAAEALFSKQLEQMDREAQLKARVEAFARASVTQVLEVAEGLARGRASVNPSDVQDFAQATREALRGTHATLRNAVTTLKPQAQAAFDARIASGEMDPALGLLMAELRTAGHVDAAMNALVERHTRLYYEDIIGQRPAPASPERVLLGLGAVPIARYLPEGARLEALLPDGRVQTFATETTVPLSPARLRDVRLLSYETDPDISFHKALAGITRVRAAQIKPGTQSRVRPLFATGEPAPLTMGLDIASPMFALAEGTRRLRVTLHMTRASKLLAQPKPWDADDQKAYLKHLLKPDRTSEDLAEMAQDRYFVDPHVRLALANDTDLAVAFLGGDSAEVIEALANEITHLAQRRREHPSLTLVYEVLTGRVRDVDQLRLLLGRILTLSMVERAPFPRAAWWAVLERLIQRFGLDVEMAGTMIFAAFSPRSQATHSLGGNVVPGAPLYRPEDVFQGLLGDAFDIHLETAEGPRAPDMMQVMPVQAPTADGGITLSLRYNASSPPLVGGRDPTAPVLTLRHAARPRVCPVSLFEGYTVETIGLQVDVSGARKVVAFSDDGKVATDQTFQPFGARPNDGATFQVGSAEMARKPVTRVGLSLDWSDLPDPPGGFAGHYAAYGKHAQIPEPKITIDYLSGDGWRPVQSRAIAMVASDEITGALLPGWEVSGAVKGHTVAAAGEVTSSEFNARQTIRAGLIRLRLEGTGDGFNAALYPIALVQAMRPRPIIGLLPGVAARPVPKAPFVPTVSRFALSYRAEAVLELSAPESAKRGERVVQVGPFGAVEVFPHRRSGQVRLFPKRLGYGQLCLQIAGPRATGPVTIAVNTSRGGHLRTVPAPNPLRWYYLAPAGWRPLPDTALSSDTTAGLMRAGLVIIDLPEDAADPSPEMPSGGAWLAAVATRPDLASFPALEDITLNAVWALRTGDVARAPDTPRDWAFVPAAQGISAITELAAPTVLRPPEPRAAFTARVAERLRHRGRAVTAWDVERLVLQEFPEVTLAKCLPHLTRKDPTPAPGQMTLVALRTPEPGAAPHAPCLFDVAALEQIRAFIAPLAPEFTRIDVVNPAFERLQVRARIQIRAEREHGAMAQRLKDEINRYLSVWTAPAALQRFGWRLNVQLLRAHITQLSYVRRVTAFSVLHLAGDDHQCHELLDTAQTKRDQRGGAYGPLIRPRAPWALPLAAPDHFLSLTEADLSDETPVAAGIGALSVGEMLIVGQRIRP